MPPQQAPARRVQISLVVLLKIVRACRAAHPLQAAGKMLGFESGDTLHITECFVYPSSAAPSQPAGRLGEASAAKEADRIDDERRKYETKILDLLELTASGAREVGMWQSFQHASLKEFDLVDQLASMQKHFPSSLLIGFDQNASTADPTQAGLHAFRLSKDFLRLRAEASVSGAQALNCLQGGSTIESVPLELLCGPTVRHFLFDVVSQGNQGTVGSQASSTASSLRVSDFEPLALNEAMQLRGSLEYMCDCLDEIPTQFDRYQRYQKEVNKQATVLRQRQEERRLENDQRKLVGEEALPQFEAHHVDFPSQVPLLVMNNQIRAMGDNIAAVMLESGEKAALLKEALGGDARRP